jgi:hypothetical protein
MISALVFIDFAHRFTDSLMDIPLQAWVKQQETPYKTDKDDYAAPLTKRPDRTAGRCVVLASPLLSEMVSNSL